MRNIALVSVLIAVVAFATPAIAEDPIQGTMQAFVVEKADDKETLKVANDVEPKQLLEYQLEYTNKSQTNIDGLTVVGPVPEGTEYVSDTAGANVSANLLVSIDGGKTFESEPVVRTETKSNGEVVEKIIPAEQYTHLKWTAASAIEAKGGKQLYSYRVRVK